jgi:AcrR family transcriptional regulator
MKKADTKERLFDASLKLISEKGYLGATTREMAQEAGVTELTLFRHFGCKEKLFIEVLSKYTFLPKLKELLPELEHLSYDDALRLVAHKFLLTLKQRKPMIKIMYSEVNLYPEKIRRVYNKFITEIRLTLASYFTSQQKKGVLRKVSPEVAARMFLGMLFSYFRTEEMMKGTDISGHKMEKDIRELVDIFIHGTANPKQ